MLVELMHHILLKRRVEASHAWRDAERRQADEHSAAVKRIIDQAKDKPDPAGSQR